MAEHRWWLLLPREVRELPADLAAVVVLVLLTNLSVFLPVVKETPLRVIFGLGFVLFLPGYAFIAALFPEAGDGGVDTQDESDEEAVDESGPLQGRGIDGIERVALSFGLSIAIVPLIGLVLNFTPWGIRLVPIILAVSGVTFGCTVVGVVRRWELPEEERFTVPYRAWLEGARHELFEPETRTDAILNVVLALSIVLAMSSVVYAVAVPKQGEAFTELYLLTEGEDGDLLADDYPTEFIAGEPQSLVVGIGNHEHRAVGYSLVVELHRVEFVNNSTRIRERERLRQWEPRVQHNETWHRNHSVAPTITGDRLRLTYLLYKDDVPVRPTADNAYRENHLWINVTSSG